MALFQAPVNCVRCGEPGARWVKRGADRMAVCIRCRGLSPPRVTVTLLTETGQGSPGAELLEETDTRGAPMIDLDLLGNV